MKKGTASQGGFRQWVILAVTIAVIITSFFFISKSIRENSNDRTRQSVYLFCTKCMSIFIPDERLGGEHPRKCDKCGEKAAWYAMQCSDCGEIFAYAPEVNAQGEIIRKQPLCPSCGSVNYQMYKPGYKKNNMER